VNTPAPTTSSIRRILIAVDVSASGIAALEAVVAFASRMEAELLGLFIEDINLLRLAALPFAREVSFLSARTRRLGGAEMERALRAQAALAEAALIAAAQREGVSCSFRVVRGEVTAELLAAAHEVDLVAIGMTRAGKRHAGSTMRGILGTAPGSLLLLPPDTQIRSPVMVIYDGSAASVNALAVAQRLAQMDSGMLTLLISGSAARMRQEVAERLAGSGLVVRYHVLSELDIIELVQSIRKEGGGTLVLGGDVALKGGTLQHLLERIDCTVLLVR
jgi:nucleotide-binding universal stress UspA family protein